MQWVVYYLSANNHLLCVQVHASNITLAVVKGAQYAGCKLDDVIVVGRKEMEVINDAPLEKVFVSRQREMDFNGKH